ncbi:subtilase [Coniochaeta ligniaria NRRL 30616]|uniref:Subtilase n=1 Tax=Coniochaeta ligniaria NRRL 30616 TaxID=1408157 RepID=A0A1J7I8M5_9PEZI|nr:subtilase [Coniochaeta ligniaria NRRL 30616]
MPSLRQLSLLLGVILPLGSLAAPVVNHTESGLPGRSPIFLNHTESGVPSPTVIGKYIVTLKQGLTSRDLESHVTWVNRVHRRSLKGNNNSTSAAGVHKTFENLHVYVGEFDNHTIEQIRSRVDVEAVEEDQLWTPYQVATPPQSAAPWGLARISHRTRGAHDYLYDANPGQDSYAYVVDTGLNTGHVDFGGRAQFGYNAVSGAADADVQGHGTHATGIIGSRTYGVAKSANLVAVKVFDQRGSLTSVILDGYNWAVSDIRGKGRVGKAVINMSLGGGTSTAFNNAVQAAYQAGVVTVVAAGNQARDVGADSPASAANAITVGAVDSSDQQASYSNFGRSVDIYAPGSSILSTWIGSSTATNTMSGTSMACPHVSGLVLYLMAKEGLTDPAAIVARVKGIGSANVISGVGPGSPNLLAYNGS